MENLYVIQSKEKRDILATTSNLQRQHKYTASLSHPREVGYKILERQRAATQVPSLPPKQKFPSARNIYANPSADQDQTYNVRIPGQSKQENPYLSFEEINCPPAIHLRSNVKEELKHSRPPPTIQGIRPRQTQSNNARFNTLQQASDKRSLTSPTRFAVNKGNDLYTSIIKSSEAGNSLHQQISPKNLSNNFSSRTSSPENFIYPEHKQPASQWRNSANYENIPKPSQCISPPVNSTREEMNLVSDFTWIQTRLFDLYKKIRKTPETAKTIKELKFHLRLPEHEISDNIIESVYMSLAPPEDIEDVEQKIMYIVDFRSFRDKQDLRHRIIEMFAKPGPPSISYSKVDSKMDHIISEFCNRVALMRETQNNLIVSPAHARVVMKGINDAEMFVKALRENQLWIRWGTASNLPPLYHLYLHKHPPSYEVRKAVTLSFVAERLKAMPNMRNKITDIQELCPPIYSKMQSNIAKNQWQVTEYDAKLGEFTTHECKFPSWLDDETTAFNFLNSSNRTSFELGSHPYALYSTYAVVIKDFTLVDEDILGINEKESVWATPSKVQFYVDSSSTGVLYRFVHVKNSHCERINNVLSDVLKLRHFRCYEGCDLVEACLALAWARRQPRAVFVLNSFLPSNMSSLSLEQKEPFKEKMLALVSHLTDGKKIGPLYDMRYGMNGTTTIQSDEE